jgi:hypothetical protein
LLNDLHQKIIAQAAAYRIQPVSRLLACLRAVIVSTGESISRGPPPMRVNELESLTLNQLKAGADSCFRDASVNDRDLVNIEHLLKAQVYLSEIAHRYDAKIARRDLILEIVVIVLIAAEIGIAWMEGRSQSKALDAMAGSANQSIIAMKSVSDSLGKLNDKQDQSLEAQRTANKNLQDSLNQTTLMATALRRQLKIIESEQATRITQAAKRPRLEDDEFLFQDFVDDSDIRKGAYRRFEGHQVQGDKDIETRTGTSCRCGASETD